MTLPYCEIRAAQAPWVGDLTATGQGGGTSLSADYLLPRKTNLQTNHCVWEVARERQTGQEDRQETESHYT